MPGPKYPLTVVLPLGRVRHAARLVDDGPRVTTLCRKAGVPTGTDPATLPYCADCASRPNPIDQRSYLPAKET